MTSFLGYYLQRILIGSHKTMYSRFHMKSFFGYYLQRILIGSHKTMYSRFHMKSFLGYYLQRILIDINKTMYSRFHMKSFLGYYPQICHVGFLFCILTHTCKRKATSCCFPCRQILCVQGAYHVMKTLYCANHCLLMI